MKERGKTIMLERLYDYKQRYEKEYLLAKAKIQVVEEMIADEIRNEKDEEATEIAEEQEVAEQPTDESY
jgi:hypothetical protein